ncbi:MAG: FG-GAP repeat protein [Planctomycetes bacterium]|nr:FG-GAP repeat protein [Planctomycetota bacterium]
MNTSRRNSFLVTTSVILVILCSPPAQAQIETQKLVLSTPVSEAWLGYAVSITNDITVGQARSGSDGTITVFRRSGTTWAEEAVLFVPDTGITGIEHSTIANTGNIIIAGAPGHPLERGKAHIFRYTGSAWLPEQVLTGPTRGFFGDATGASGNVVVVGDWLYNSGTMAATGSAFVYRYDSTLGIWQSETQLLASDVESAAIFGFSLSSSGDRILVGSPYKDAAGTNSGAAYIFEYDNILNVWNQTARLVASDASPGADFGWGVSLFNDIAVIGAPGAGSGAAYVYRKSGSVWSEEAVLAPSLLETLSFFGNSVSVSNNNIVIGAPFDGSTGSAFLFRYDGSSWPQIAKLAPSDGAADDRFGYEVFLSGDVALIGAPYHDDGAFNSGAAYVFSGLVGSDCNDNGIPDADDISSGFSADANGNSVPDECETARGDFNLDGMVNVTDLLSLLGVWGPCPGCPQDTNVDSKVNVTDLLTVLGNWGPI